MNRPLLRALALLLAVAVGVGGGSLIRSGHAHKSAARAAALLAVSSVDTQHVALDVDRTAAAPRPAAGAVGGGTRDSSSSVSFRTAQSPQVRGPPGQCDA